MVFLGIGGLCKSLSMHTLQFLSYNRVSILQLSEDPIALITGLGSISPRQSSHQCLFALLGPACANAACKTLMQLSAGGVTCGLRATCILPTNADEVKKGLTWPLDETSCLNLL